MNAPNLMVFGISSSRKDEKIVDEVMDILDEYLEDEWEIVAWSRRSGTRFLVRATVESRSIIMDKFLKANIRPISEMIEEMTESKVKWLVPKKVKVGTPAELAERTVYGWLDAMWSADPGPSGSGIKHESERVPKDSPKAQDNAEEISSAPAQSPASAPAADSDPASPSDAQRAVLEMFGLTGEEVDEDGEPINLFVMGPS